MLFGIKLANELYPPWRESYIDYEGLKLLLKEPAPRGYNPPNEGGLDVKIHHEDPGMTWTEQDESAFVAALDRELEKVYSFESGKFNCIMERLNLLEEIVSTEEGLKSLDFQGFGNDLELALNEAQELDNFSRLNFTGFVKIVKKHDGLHGEYPSVKSLLQVRLKELPFHTEEYSPLLYKISFLYEVLRNNTGVHATPLANSTKLSDVASGEEVVFHSYKFWIHPDNLMEVNTRILRHLPMLVYASAPSEGERLLTDLISDVPDEEDESTSVRNPSIFEPHAGVKRTYGPMITALYFDNAQFELYNNKLLKNTLSPTLRLRWIGRLADKPDVFLEKRMLVGNNKSDCGDLEETRIKLKPKFIGGLISGSSDFKERTLARLRERGTTSGELARFEEDFNATQKFIIQNELKPILRTMYARTAFQIPGDDRIRITIDSDIVYFKEYSFGGDKPSSKTHSWYRTDLDVSNANQMSLLKPDEHFKFPYSVMEIKIKNPVKSVGTLRSTSLSDAHCPTKQIKWIGELTNSHLVKEVPRFSKYLQGIAQLFGEDEGFELLPFWLSDLESNIKKDPKQAYEEEEQRIKREKEVREKVDKIRRLSSLPNAEEVAAAQASYQKSMKKQQQEEHFDVTREADLEDSESSDDEAVKHRKHKKTQRMKKDPGFFNILAGRDSKLSELDSEDEEIELPPGVKRPAQFIKNTGPLKVEAKVWLANERTLNKWITITVSLSVLTFSLLNSRERSAFPRVSNMLTYIYFALTIFTGVWAFMTYMHRLRVISERSGQHLDAPLGPLVFAGVLTVTLCINFVMAFRQLALNEQTILEAASNNLEFKNFSRLPVRLRAIQKFIFRVVGATVGNLEYSDVPTF